MKPHRIWLIALFAYAVASVPAQAQPAPNAPSMFRGATAWLNSPPLSEADLRGKVVLVNFWTFTCINWLRQSPYVRAWADKYKDQGLVVIGVHAPEFAFEKNVDDVRRMARDLMVDYPIAIDNDHTIWRAFTNSYWPALYFIDAQGKLRHQQFGEGEYEASERMLQQLLAEAGNARNTSDQAKIAASGIDAAADWRNLKSPENYLGYARTQNFLSGGGNRIDVPSIFRAMTAPPLNWWSLNGTWTVGAEFISSVAASGKIAYRFQARDLHLVMAPAMADRPVRFRITLDGRAPGADHGLDVDAEGFGTMDHGRLYQLVRHSGMVMERTFEIEFIDPGARAYAFTFG